MSVWLTAEDMSSILLPGDHRGNVVEGVRRLVLERNPWTGERASYWGLVVGLVYGGLVVYWRIVFGGAYLMRGKVGCWEGSVWMRLSRCGGGR